MISWVAPDDGGSPLIGYSVTIKQKDSAFSADSVNCDMTASTLTTCTIPVAVLRAAPFSLDWGDSVFAKVIATNLYGDSLESLEGNGAYITTNPDQPTNLVEDYSQRTKSTLAIDWTAPVFTGGDVIEDYRINYREQGGSYSVLASGLTSLTYTAIGLTAGVTYQFTVESRNSYGYSVVSEELTLLCAFIPEPTASVTTTNLNDEVVIAWVEPVTNGSPITAYKVFIQ